MIGTFYRSSNPDSPPFVSVGDKVSKGQVVCIIEAMKLFNEIESEVSGTIVKASIENFAKMKGDKKILLLGSMMELGTESEKEHADIVSLIDQNKWDAVVLVGKNFKEIKNNYKNFENSLQARDWLKKENVQNAQILIKGSRSMQMEKVLEGLE